MFGVPVAEPRDEDFDDGLGVGQHLERAELGVVAPFSFGAQLRLEVLFGEVGEPDVEVHADAELVHGLEERLPVGIAQGGQIRLVRFGDEQHAVVAPFVAADRLPDAGVHVPDREGGQQDEPVRSFGGEVGQEVVVGRDTGDGELLPHPPEGGVGERQQVGIQGLSRQAVLVHALQPLPYGEGAAVGDLVERAGVGRRVFRPAGEGVVGDAGEALAADDPAVHGVPLVEFDVGDGVAPAGLREP